MAETSFTSLADFYQNSPYAAFQQEHRRGGSFGVQMIHAQQDGHELVDPAIDEIAFVGILQASGSAELEFGDGWKKHVHLRGGMVDLQPAQQVNQLRVKNAHEVMVAVAPLAQVALHLSQADLDIRGFDPLYAAMRGGAQELGLITSMWAAMKEGGAANNLLVDGLFLALLGRFSAMTHAKATLGSPVGLDDLRLARVVDYIEAHFSDPLRMDELARVACLSLVQFSRNFKAAFRQSPHAYLTSRRVAHAKTLLHTARLNITDIGLLCGFATPSHFSTVFQKCVGVSPRQYRLAVAPNRALRS
jgi:AraC family transcriptional regulator